MPEIGQTISHYRIIEKLGQGGMGEVFLAADTSLDRKVALKFLPDIFSGDPERLARFEREAKLLASLNHPNIAMIYGLEQADGKRFLAMELVEGETLAQQIERGPLPVVEALEVCRQIAEGVEAAHEKGIIHRDLKPANVKITPEGKVKVLDFGLAKAFSEEPSAVDLSHSPTLTDQMTRPGVILGTAAYMSPEQAKGKTIDKRADIWAFGCVLYECLTGRRAFEGETVTESIAAVLMREPSWKLLPQTVPGHVKNLLHRCLQKNVDRRLRDIGDAALELETFQPEPAEQSTTLSRIQHNRWFWAGMALALLLSALIGAWSGWRFRPGSSEDTAGPSRFAIPLDGPKRTDVRLEIPSLVITDDGLRIAWIGGKGAENQIFTRNLGDLEIRPIPGTKGVKPATLSFSPDGQWICFPRGNTLYTIPVSGGTPTAIYKAQNPAAVLFGLDWTDDGIILAESDSGLSRISRDGGTKESLTEIDHVRQEVSHGGPRLLPGGKGLLFYVCVKSFDNRHVEVLDMETRKRTFVIDDVELSQYLPSGHLLFVRDYTFYLAPFDLRKMRVTGKEFSLQIPAQMDYLNRAGFWDISENGTLVYVPHDPATANTQLAWIDKNRNREPLALPAGNYQSPMLSPKGDSVAYNFSPPGVAGSEIWTYEFSRRVPNQFTHLGKASGEPIWRPDRPQIIFDSSHEGQWNLYSQDLNGKGAPSRLHKSDSQEAPHSFSPDGKFLLFTQRSTKDQFDLKLLDMEHLEANPIDFAADPKVPEFFGRFSPVDKRWIAYTAEEAGRFEIFVKEFMSESPGSGQVRRISPAGGVEPVWSSKGDRIYYRSEDGTRIYSVPFQAHPNLVLGQVSEVLTGISLPQFEILIGATSYDISPDGNKFIMVIAPENAGLASNLVVVQQWFEELKRLVSTGRR